MNCTRIILVVSLLGLVGCASPPMTDTVTLEFDGVESAVDYDDLAAVLDRTVGEDGYVYLELMCRRRTPPDAAAESVDSTKPQPITDLPIDEAYTTDACNLRRRLDQQVKRLAVAGPNTTPTLFPTAADRLTYWYNARCAWVLRLLVAAWDRHQTEIAHPNTPQPPTVAFGQRRFRIDGGVMTLEGIDAAIARQGGPLAVMVAPGLDLRRAKLPARPFEAKTIYETLPERLNVFLADENRFLIDIMNQRVLIPPVIWQYREKLLAEHLRDYGVPDATLTTALMPLVSGAAQRRLQNALGYTPVPNTQPRFAIVYAD